jgi:hypothetical protein
MINLLAMRGFRKLGASVQQICWPLPNPIPAKKVTVTWPAKKIKKPTNDAGRYQGFGFLPKRGW